jgi:putative CocE/NonD family hydrolase
MHIRLCRVLIPILLGLFAACAAVQEQGYPRNQALYVMMRDGVEIAVDVWLPEKLELGDKLPAIIRATRYWRAVDMVDDSLEKDSNFAEAELFNDAGYALVIVDGRGSGASFGTRPYELSEDEAADYGEIADWIAAQPWSNQRVGAYGVSYAGNTTEMLLVSRRPAVKAVAPLFNDFDNFGHLVFPGGLLTIGFLERWGETVHYMDLNDICAVARVTESECEELTKERRGVKPVDADEDGSLLAAAIQEHAGNVHPYEAALEYEYRDDPWREGGVRGVGYKRSPAGHLPDIDASGVPMLIRVGWLDAATVNGALGRYMTISNPQRVFIGPWDHGARNNADPFLPEDTPVEPSREEQYVRLLEFFDTFLKEDGSGSLESEIHYYTLGAGEWKTTKVWPPEGFESERWYLGADGLLGREPPQNEAGADRYEVDFEATTGRHNRWYTNGGAGDVIYPDRLITLYVASTTTDGAFIVYLEDVAPDGRVTYITEGQLRGVMRRVTEEPPLYKKLGPHRTELRADAMPLVPGEVAEITFELWATSVLIKQGHRIRVAVSGADKDTFLRYPKSGETPTFTVERNRHHASLIQLPMKPR